MTAKREILNIIQVMGKTMFVKKLLVIVFILAILSSKIFSQQYLNLDFETSTPTGSAIGWYQGGQGYEVKVDTTVFYSGKKSLRMVKLSNGGFGLGTLTFPIDDAKGKHLRYTSYIKTEGITNGYAGLWWRVDGKDKNKMQGFDNMAGRGPSGTTPWTRYSIEMDIDTAIQNINFGVLMPGDGKAWFDDLQIELDGKIYEQIEPKPFIPNDDQIVWLKENVIQFNTAEPIEDDEDLIKLKSIIGNARIVSLGEGTHGTSEFFKMKHRITKFLAEKMGFTVFAIEANMPEARKVNEYVLTGKGDPKEALAGLYFWTWNTQEVLDMIEWMRQFNASGKGRIEFWGFDMQFPQVAMENVSSFIEKVEPAYLDSLTQIFTKIKEYDSELKKTQSRSGILFEPVYNLSLQVLNHLLKRKSDYLKILEPTIVDFAFQDAKLILQSYETFLQGKASRDESMAANVDWILAHTPPNTKIVLWAHNGHVSKNLSAYKSMGSFLANRYTKDMVVFGFAFHEGNYTAVGKNGLGVYGTSFSQPGSIEFAFHKTGLPRFILDLRSLSTSPLSNWLNKNLDMRSIGAMAMDYAFYNTIVSKEFDAIIYFDNTTPSKLLKLHE